MLHPLHTHTRATPALTGQQAVPDGHDHVGSDGRSSEVGGGGIKHRWNAVHPSLVLQMLNRPAARRAAEGRMIEGRALTALVSSTSNFAQLQAPSLVPKVLHADHRHRHRHPLVCGGRQEDVHAPQAHAHHADAAGIHVWPAGTSEGEGRSEEGVTRGVARGAACLRHCREGPFSSSSGVTT